MRLIALVIIIPIAIGGALWWYFEVYRSAVYARAVFPLWEEVETLNTRTEFSEVGLKDERDYQGALEALRKRRAVIEDIRERLVRLEPSGALAQTHNDFTALLDGYVAMVIDAEKKAKFFAQAQDLQALLREHPSSVPSIGAGSSESSAGTISDVTRLLEGRIPQLKSIGGEIFTKGFSRLFSGTPFDKLLSGWQDAAPALDTVLKLVRGFDPNLPASQLPKLLQSSNEQTELDRMNRFLEEAESASRTTPARDILAYRSFAGEGGMTKEGLELRAQHLRAAMTELKKKYPPKP